VINMAEETEILEREEELLPEWDEDEQDVLLQTQMWVYNFIMAQWKRMLVGFGAILLVVLVQGLYQESVVEAQREIHSEVALVINELPEPNPMAQYGLAPMDNPKDTERIESLRTSAKNLEQIASEGSGTASWYAWMDAAKVWDRADEQDARIVVLKKATEVPVSEDLQVTSGLILANAYHSQGQTDEAIKVLESFDGYGGLLKYQRSINLANLYIAAGNSDSAKELFGSLTQAPESLAEQIASLQTQMEG
jgi:predicted negative regulator of RcsB-dependent stress response